MRRTKTILGFSLVELMIVVAIIAILAAVAMPIFNRYVRRSKTSEALVNLRKIYDGELLYHEQERTDAVGAVITKQFIAIALNPATITARKRTGDWSLTGWPEIRFAPDSPVLFSYRTTATGTELTDPKSTFVGFAYGDQDGDAVTSSFSRGASLNSAGEIVGWAGVYSQNEAE
jgi:prepilin-type N-terminal cleavage/methylation domain-containing protein